MVDQIVVGLDVGDNEVSDADHVDGGQFVVVVTSVKQVADGEGGIEDHPVAKVVLGLDLHFDDKQVAGLRGTFDINNAVAGVLAQADLLLGFEGDRNNVFVRENCAHEQEEQVLVTGCPENEFEGVIDPRVDEGNALGGGLPQEF